MSCSIKLINRSHLSPRIIFRSIDYIAHFSSNSYTTLIVPYRQLYRLIRTICGFSNRFCSTLKKLMKMFYSKTAVCAARWTLRSKTFLSKNVALTPQLFLLTKVKLIISENELIECIVSAVLNRVLQTLFKCLYSYLSPLLHPTLVF